MTKNELKEYWETRGLFFNTWSPGDGVTRYRFTLDSKDDSFGPGNGIYTALGWKEAITFATGFVMGKE